MTAKGLTTGEIEAHLAELLAHMEALFSEQRFFLGWSQVWRRKYRESELVRRLVIDPHSPSLVPSVEPP